MRFALARTSLTTGPVKQWAVGGDGSKEPQFRIRKKEGSESMRFGNISSDCSFKPTLFNADFFFQIGQNPSLLPPNSKRGSKSGTAPVIIRRSDRKGYGGGLVAHLCFPATLPLGMPLDLGGRLDFQRRTFSAAPSTPHTRMTRALSLPRAEAHARKQATADTFVAVAKGVAVAAVTAAVAAGIVSTVSAFFSRRRAARTSAAPPARPRSEPNSETVLTAVGVTQ